MIPGIPLRAHVGITAEERRTEQEVVVHLALYLDLAPAGVLDNLAKTVDYDAVCEAVGSVVASRSFHLIEAVAEEVARSILTDFGVDTVDVRVEKPGALRERGVAFAAVEIRRARDG